MNLKGEYYVSLVYKLMVQDSLKVRIFEIEKMLQWGTPKDLEEYKQWSEYFRLKKNNPLQFRGIEDIDLILIDWKGLGNAEQRDQAMQVINKFYIQKKRTSEVSK